MINVIEKIAGSNGNVGQLLSAMDLGDLAMITLLIIVLLGVGVFLDAMVFFYGGADTLHFNTSLGINNVLGRAANGASWAWGHKEKMLQMLNTNTQESLSPILNSIEMAIQKFE